MQRLFIGGRLDGQWREACDQFQAVPYVEPVTFSEYLKAEPDWVPSSSATKYENYVAQPWEDGKYRVYVMALEGLSPTDVMKNLMNGYCPAAANEREGESENGRSCKS